MRGGIALLALGLVCVVTAGCKDTTASAGAAESASPEAIGTAECASCGMVVREQPAPRAQVIHRDGTRAHFCAIDDLLHYLPTPSPHGAVTAVFVEVLEPGVDPKVHDHDSKRWVRAETATYVVGVPRERIMGRPVLVFETPQVAQGEAQRLKARAIDWATLQKTIHDAPLAPPSDSQRPLASPP